MNFTMNNTTYNAPNMGIVSFAATGDYASALARNQGNPQAFEIFAKQFEPKLMAIALVFTHVRRDAEDIVQETLRKGFLDLHQFEGESSFFTWLTRLVIKEAFMLFRKRGTLRAPSLDF